MLSWVAEVPSGCHRSQQCCAEQHVLMALKQPLVPCHLALFCLFFSLCLWEEDKEDLLCSWSQVAHCTDCCKRMVSEVWAGALSRLWVGEQVIAVLWKMLPVLESLWKNPLHLFAFSLLLWQTSENKQNTGEAVGRIFWGSYQVTFSASGELRVWIGI